MKKLAIVLLGACMAAGLTACGNASGGKTNQTPAATAGTTAGAPADTKAPTEAAVPTAEATKDAMSGAITVVSREDGSGTRGAFIELFKVEQKNAEGKKIDYTTEDAEITNSTSVMMSTIAGNKGAIGYISLGSLNDTVKALKIDGAVPSAEAIKSGEYKISRPFNIVTKGDISAVTQDFINYISSQEGQAIAEENMYISQGNTGAYTAGNVSGKLVIAGSSSVTPLMEKIKESYVAINPDVTIEIQTSDSTTGVASTVDGICDIGMASRALTEKETAAGLVPLVIAMDGIAVIVNQENPVDDVASETIKAIFTGETGDWADVQ